MQTYFDIYDEHKTAIGVPIEPMTDEHKELWSDFMEDQTPSVDGVSMEDWGKGWGMFIARFIAKMNE